MDFVVRENIRHLRQMLYGETDPVKLETIEKLLKEAEGSRLCQPKGGTRATSQDDKSIHPYRSEGHLA